MRMATSLALPVRQRQARHGDLPGRNLRACSGRGAREDLQEAMTLIDAHEYGNGTCIFTRDGEAAAFLPTTSRSAWWASTCPCPCRWPTTPSAAGSDQLFGDLHAYGPDAVRFYTKRKTITQRWPSAGVREQCSAFPATADRVATAPHVGAACGLSGCCPNGRHGMLDARHGEDNTMESALRGQDRRISYANCSMTIRHYWRIHSNS